MSPESTISNDHYGTVSSSSSFELPEWLYSYNLYIMRIGFYNQKTGGLLELGICNNAHDSRYRSFFLFPQNMVEMGVVNTGSDYSCIRLGIANLNDNVSHPGLNIGLFNQSRGWQIGGIGNGKGSLQMNLVNYGSNTVQMGLINTTSDEEGCDQQQWQLGILNTKFNDKKRNLVQTGIVNITGQYHQTQFGLVNCSYSENGPWWGNHQDMQVGLLNFSATTGENQIGLVNFIWSQFRSHETHLGLLNIGIHRPYIFPFCFPDY